MSLSKNLAAFLWATLIKQNMYVTYIGKKVKEARKLVIIVDNKKHFPFSNTFRMNKIYKRKNAKNFVICFRIFTTTSE